MMRDSFFILSFAKNPAEWNSLCLRHVMLIVPLNSSGFAFLSSIMYPEGHLTDQNMPFRGCCQRCYSESPAPKLSLLTVPAIRPDGPMTQFSHAFIYLLMLLQCPVTSASMSVLGMVFGDLGTFTPELEPLTLTSEGVAMSLSIFNNEQLK